MPSIRQRFHLSPCSDFRSHFCSNRSLAYIKKGLFDYALTDSDEAIRLNPTLETAYVNRGIAHEGLGRQEDAENDFDKAVELGYKREAIDDELCELGLR